VLLVCGMCLVKMIDLIRRAWQPVIRIGNIERCASRLMKDGIPPTYSTHRFIWNTVTQAVPSVIDLPSSGPTTKAITHHPSPSNASLPFNLPLPRFQSQQNSSPRLRTATSMKVSPSSSLSANNKSSPQQHRTGEMFQGTPR
jgi:hypothetical protein